jgi:hypothetical protein
MVEKQPKLTPRTTFTPREYKDGSGWYVEAIGPDGCAENIGGFHSDSEARDWISAKSAAYAKAHEH